MLEILKPGPDGIHFVLAGQERARKIYNAFFNLFFPLHVKTKQNAVWPRFDPSFFSCFFSCHFFSFTGSLAFVVGRDTVIFSYTWKKKKEASHRRYYFNLCRIFTKKETVSVEKIIIFLCLGFLCPPLSFSHLSEKPVELKSNAFSYCNFVYWFSMRAWLCVCVCARSCVGAWMCVYRSDFITKHRWL